MCVCCESLCCQVEVFASGRALVQRIPTVFLCVFVCVCLCVIECDPVQQYPFTPIMNTQKEVR